MNKHVRFLVGLLVGMVLGSMLLFVYLETSKCHSIPASFAVNKIVMQKVNVHPLSDDSMDCIDSLNCDYYLIDVCCQPDSLYDVSSMDCIPPRPIGFHKGIVEKISSIRVLDDNGQDISEELTGCNVTGNSSPQMTDYVLPNLMNFQIDYVRDVPYVKYCKSIGELADCLNQLKGPKNNGMEYDIVSGHYYFLFCTQSAPATIILEFPDLRVESKVNRHLLE